MRVREFFLNLSAAFVLLLLLVLAPSERAGAMLDRPPVPDVTANAVYVFDIDAGAELYTLNEREQLPPASLTKIATALLLVRNVDDLTQTVVIEPGDLATEGESTMALQAGDVVTYMDLLYGLLLPSGNDAANAVARVIGGQLLANEGASGENPTVRFVAEMNALASELGLDETQFLNPTGLHLDGHVSSARDMAVLARRAFTQRTIRDVIRQAEYVVTYQGPAPREATLRTTVLLKQEGADGVLGGKTGTTAEAGACLILETEHRGGNRVITVILGSAIEFAETGERIDESDRRYDDARTILDGLEKDYRWVDISRGDEIPGLHEELLVWDVGLKNDTAIVVPRVDQLGMDYLLQLGPEARPEEEVGRVLFFLGAEQVAERAVIQLAPGATSLVLTPAA